MNKRLAASAAWFLSAACLWLRAMEFFVAPIAYQDQSGESGATVIRPDIDLAHILQARPFGDYVKLRSLPDVAGEAPQTFVDAARLCQIEACPYLFYGYVKRTSFSYYAEIKLMAQENKELVAVFVGGDDDRHYERLMGDLAGKITNYIRDELGIGPPLIAERPARNLLVLPVSIGYWIPMAGAWNSALAGLVSASTGIRFIPERPLYSLLSRHAYFDAGLDLAYLLGMNRQGLESFLLHGCRLRLPVESFLDLGKGHELGIGLGPLFEVDVLNQAHRYGSRETKTSIVPGISAELLYRYALTDALSLGLSNTLDVLLYDQVLCIDSPRLSLVFRLGTNEEAEQP